MKNYNSQRAEIAPEVLQADPRTGSAVLYAFEFYGYETVVTGTLYDFHDRWNVNVSLSNDGAAE